MNAARIVVPTIALGAGGVAAYVGRESGENSAAAEAVAQLPTTKLLVAKSGSIARRSEIILTNIRVLAIDQAPKRGSSNNVVRYGIASQSTAQK